MKKNSGIIWGIVLVVLGVILGGNALDLFNVDIFFDGWWTLFIIIPCLSGLLNDSDKKGNLIGLVIGILLLLACQDLMDFELVFKLMVPTIIVVIGLSLIFKNIFGGKINEEIKRINAKKVSNGEYCATFAGQEFNLNNEDFDGATTTAVFGGIKLDLRKAIIKEDVVINATAVFGGIEIDVPENVSVKIKSTSIFGGVDNKAKDSDNKEITIYVNATCLFGGVDIK